jgi:glycine oxidase
VGRPPDTEGLLLAVGHHRNGILLSATTAELVTELVRGAPLPESARAFRADRFAR